MQMWTRRISSRFLNFDIGFTEMFDLVIEACDVLTVINNPTLSDIIASDAAAREYVRSAI